MPKIAVIGNGAIGTIVSLKLIESGHNIDLFGESSRLGSASKAAGAMINVFAELEDHQLENVYLKKNFELSLESSKKWDKFLLKDLNFKSNFSKRKTVIFKNKYSSLFELKHFSYLKKLKNEYKNDIYLDTRFNKFLNNREEKIILPNEKFIDSSYLLNKLDSLLQIKKVNLILDKKQYKIKCYNQGVELNFDQKKKKYDYLIIAAGSFSQNIFNSNKDLFKNVPKVFYGTGVGLKIQKNKFSSNINNKNSVYRTMNRGNACGFHLVPTDYGYYFGATNHISAFREDLARVKSLKVLSEGLVEQFNTKFEEHNLDYVVGHRPTSADAFPLLGPLKKNNKIIIATGNKRNGLTCSLEIADLIKNYVNGDKCSFHSYKVFIPERKLISYFDQETAIKNTAESLASGTFMHSKHPENVDMKKEIAKETNKLHQIYKKLKIKKFGIHPELINMYKFKRI